MKPAKLTPQQARECYEREVENARIDLVRAPARLEDRLADIRQQAEEEEADARRIYGDPEGDYFRAVAQAKKRLRSRKPDMTKPELLTWYEKKIKVQMNKISPFWNALKKRGVK